MTKHTPGPWKVKHWYIIGPNGEVDSDFNKANAQLIAAAPELYEACKKLLKAGESMDADQWYEAKVLGKQALAKAQGNR